MIVSGIGVHSALGQGVERWREGVEGRSQPDVHIQEVKIASGTKAVRTFKAPEPALPVEVPESIKRRMSRLAKMYFAASFEAVEEAFGRDRRDLNLCPDRVGLVVGTAFGNLSFANAYFHRIQLEGPAGASPTLFAGSIHNSLASQLSIAFGILGPTSTVSTMEETVPGALRLAWDWLNEEVVSHVLVVVGEEIADHHVYATAHLERPPILGEGVVAFVLSRQKHGRNYAQIGEVIMSGLPKQASAADFQHRHLYGFTVSDLAFELAAQCLRLQAPTNVRGVSLEPVQ